MQRLACRCLGLGLFVLAHSLYFAPSPSAAQGGEAPPPAVGVAPVKAEDVTQSMEFVGRVEAIQQVDLRARVEGFLEKLDFAEGSAVKAGQLLFEIETAPYEAALAGARAALATGHASLAGARAALKQAQQDVDRQTTLVQKGSVAQAVLDTATAKRDEAQAHVESANAQIAQAEAQIKTAELNLSYTRVHAPIDGRIGKTNATVGNLVGPQTGVLASVVQADPIRAVFSISERDYVAIAERHRGEGGGADAEVRDGFVPTLRLPDGNDYEHPGKIAFIDNRVDPATGTIAVRADFANPDIMLVPGQFVTVTVAAGQPQSLPVVPAAAVLQDREGPYVLVVDQDNRAQIRRIEAGRRTAGGVAVASGLTEGETIVVNGLQRVRPGQVVTPQPAAAGS